MYTQEWTKKKITVSLGTKTSKLSFTHEETSEWHDFQRGDLKFNFRVRRKEYHKMIANQCFANKDVLLIWVSCLPGERKETSTDTTAWSDLTKGQSCKARHESGEEVRRRSSREAFPSETLRKRARKSIIWVRDRTTEKFKVWMPVRSLALAWWSSLTWCALKWPSTKIFADECRYSVKSRSSESSFWEESERYRKGISDRA